MGKYHRDAVPGGAYGNRTGIFQTATDGSKMNGKQLGLLIVLLVLLGGAGLLVQHKRNDATSTATPGAGGKLLGENFPINDVAAIEIKQGTNDLNLAKKDDLWRVQERNNYPAAFSQISQLLVKAQDLKVVESDEITPVDLADLQLAPAGPGTNSGTELTLKNKDGKAIDAITLGKSHTKKPAHKSPDDESIADGRYVLLGGDTHNALLVADALTEVEAQPQAWLNKDFFKIERPRAISVSYTNATNSWKIERTNEASSWMFMGAETNEQPDTNKLIGVGGALASPTFEDVLTSAKPEDIGLDKPTVVTVVTFDDFTYEVKLGNKNGENYPLTVSVTANLPKERAAVPGEKPDEKDKADKAWQEQQKALNEKLKQAKAFESWVYSVPSWNLEGFLKDRKDLMVDKKDDTKPGDATSAPAGDDKKDAPPASLLDGLNLK